MSREKRARLSASFRSQPSLLALAKEREQKQQEQVSLSPPRPLARWSELPLELVVAIVALLPARERARVYLVCRRWSGAAHVPSLWSSNWITLKPNLFKLSPDFWEVMRSRFLHKVKLQGYTLSDQNRLGSDLLLLSSTALHLTALHIDCGGKLDSKIFKHVLNFKNLTDLKLDFLKCLYTSTSIVIMGHLVLKDLPHLESLSLVGVVDIAHFDIGFLSHPTLSLLSLDTCGSLKAVTTNNLVSHFPRLKKLVIKNCVFYYSFIADEKTPRNFAPCLKEVSLVRTSFNGSLCKFPSWFRCLESLNLFFCKQEHTQLSNVLSQLTNLTSINLAGNFCSNETLKFISSPFLKSLDLSYNQDVSIEGLYYLSSVARDTLKELSLSHCSRLVSKREEAREILPQLFPNLEKINLSGWNLASYKIKTLLLQCPHLLQLHCDNNSKDGHSFHSNHFNCTSQTKIYCS